MYRCERSLYATPIVLIVTITITINRSFTSRIVKDGYSLPNYTTNVPKPDTLPWSTLLSKVSEEEFLYLSPLSLKIHIASITSLNKVLNLGTS